MEEIEPQILFGDVMHRRLFPKVNGFQYSIYYLAFPLSKISNAPIKQNKFSALSFYHKDHADRTGDGLNAWARDILNQYNVDQADGEIILVCMPRVLGYVFNPVSFWLCLDKMGELRAVICEVNNTFSETHSYLCVHDAQRVISNKDWLEAQKVFHVSPFLHRTGEYKFRFDYKKGRFGVWIDYYDEEQNKQLVTSLIGSFEPMSKKTLRRAFWRYPLVTFKAIMLIHWQALKLISKGIRYIPRPKQLTPKLTRTANLKNADVDNLT